MRCAIISRTLGRLFLVIMAKFLTPRSKGGKWSPKTCRKNKNKSTIKVSKTSCTIRHGWMNLSMSWRKVENLGVKKLESCSWLPSWKVESKTNRPTKRVDYSKRNYGKGHRQSLLKHLPGINTRQYKKTHQNSLKFSYNPNRSLIQTKAKGKETGVKAYSKPQA